MADSNNGDKISCSTTGQETDISKKNDLIYNMLGSATSGAIARAPFHPLDTIKAKLQVQQTVLNQNIQGASYALKDSSMAFHSDPHSQSRILPKLRSKLPYFGKFIAGDPFKYTLDRHSMLFSNSFDGLRRVLLREGVAGLYRGITVSVLAGCPATCLYFTGYEFTRRKLSEYDYFAQRSYISDFLGGFMAEIGSCILWVPIDVIKERMQVQSLISPDKRYHGITDAFRKMFANEGIHGLYRAYGATIASFGPFSAIYLMLYEQFKFVCVKQLYDDDIGVHELPAWTLATCACASGAISAVVTNPLDMVKLRMQVQRGGIYEFGYRNIVDGLTKLAKYENFGSMFHGAGARVAFWVPNLAVNLTLYETCTRFYKKNFTF